MFQAQKLKITVKKEKIHISLCYYLFLILLSLSPPWVSKVQIYPLQETNRANFLIQYLFYKSHFNISEMTHFMIFMNDAKMLQLKMQ